MNWKEKHIIQKVIVEVFTGSLQTGKYLEQNIGVFLRKEVFPVIENYLSQFEDGLDEDSIQIDSLALDLKLNKSGENGIDSAQIKQSIIEQIDGKVYPFVRPYLADGKDNGKISAVAAGFLNGEISGDSLKTNSEGKDIVVRFTTKEEKIIRAWFDFLESGNLPWWAEGFNMDNLDIIVQSMDIIGFQSLKQKLLPLLAKERVQIRLISQYPFVDIISLLFWLKPKGLGKSVKKSEIVRAIKEWNQVEKYHFLSLLFPRLFSSREKWDLLPFARHFSRASNQSLAPDYEQKVSDLLSVMLDKKEGISSDSLWRDMEKYFSFFRDGESTETKVSEWRIYNTPPEIVDSQNSQSDKAKEEEITVVEWTMHHAGLILLHPFLQAFFQDCEVMDENGKFRDKVMAMHLLYYVATKKVKPMEYELIFEKFLCGIPFQQPIIREIELPERHKEKAEMLLSSLLEHWKRLKNTHVDTVRFEFLQRKGKLIMEENRAQLTMERKVQDILLDGLPWNMGIVKLPWKRELIFVEW